MMYIAYSLSQVQRIASFSILKALCHDIKAIFNKLVSRDITTPIRWQLIENSVRDLNQVGVVMSRVTPIY